MESNLHNENRQEQREHRRLVVAVAEGDRSGEWPLLQPLMGGLRLMLYRELSDRDMVEDILQETCCVVLMRLRDGAISEEASLASYARTVARNLLRNHFRLARVRHEMTEPALIDSARDLVNHCPMGMLIGREIRDLVEEMLAQLDSPRDEELLRRYLVEGADRQLLCADLGLTSIQFSRVLYRARQRLQELLIPRLEE